MEEEKKKLLKFLLRNGQVLSLNCDPFDVENLILCSKFIEMDDGVNKVYIAEKDICAFEILSDRPQQETPDA